VQDIELNVVHPLVTYVCRGPLRRRCHSVCLAILLCGCRSATPDLSLTLKPEPALDYIAEGFDRYPVVALSELHGNRESAAFLAMLIRHDGFSRRVNDIVVEFGNAAYQPVVDRYISGAPVGRDELRGVWENTTQISGIWHLPMYEGILADIRMVNATLPANRRYRVLLGDPPIDWSKVTSPADEDMNDWRDAHFAWVLEHYVFARNRRALLFIGGAHISRKVLFPNSVIHLLDARFPGKTLVVSALDAGKVEPAVAAAMSAWPIPSVAPVRGTMGRTIRRADDWLHARTRVDSGRCGRAVGSEYCASGVGPCAARRRIREPRASPATQARPGDPSVPRRIDSVRSEHDTADGVVFRTDAAGAERAVTRSRPHGPRQGVRGCARTRSAAALDRARGVGRRVAGHTGNLTRESRVTRVWRETSPLG
jgi:hypothetical protein